MKITVWLLDLVAIDLTQFNDDHGSCDVDSWTDQPRVCNLNRPAF